MLVIYHIEPEGCWAELPDIAGFSAAADSIADLRAQVRQALDELLPEAIDDLDERFDPQLIQGEIQVSIGGFGGGTLNPTRAHVRLETSHPMSVRRVVPA
jgi:predicted RNase H-like HicB family nuclease